MKMSRLIPLAVAALLVAPLAACSAGSGSSSSSGYPDMTVVDPVAQDGGFVGEDAESLPAAGRSVIRSGDISIRVGDPAEAAAEVTEIADRLDGYVESESIGRGDEGSSSSAFLTLRVPADRLDEAFDALGGVGTVLSQSRSASDVTTQHVDLQARVSALEESIERLTELMSGAATTSELLEAEAALSQRQQELDGLRAQLESLEGQIEQATVSVSLTTKSALPGGPDNFWDGLVAGWNSLVSAGAGALVVIGILLPWLVILGVIALAIVLIVRARRRARRSRPGPHGGPAGAPAPTAVPPAAAAQTAPAAQSTTVPPAAQPTALGSAPDPAAPPAAPEYPDQHPGQHPGQGW
ncbi:MAG: DUF4349 domain-containing protein [Leucobacter sp.]